MEVSKKVEWCPIFGGRHEPHLWGQVDAIHVEANGGTTDLVRCVYCLTYLQVVRPS